MTARDRAEVSRLCAELTADIAALEELAHQLAAWSQREAGEAEVLIPAALLHHFYTGVETFLVRLAIAFEGSEPSGPDSHQRLLSLSVLEVPEVRPAWLAAPQLEALRELLGFRHLFRHGYAMKYRPARLKELALLATVAWPGIRGDLQRALQQVAQLATPG